MQPSTIGDAGLGEPENRALRRSGLQRGVAASLLMLPLAAGAHSFGSVYKLPVPVWLYLYAAAAALLLSFLVLGYFVSAAGGPARKNARLEIGASAPLRLLRGLRIVSALRVLGVLLLLLCIATGLFGTRNAYGNFNMTFFWVVFALGFAYCSALLGDGYAVLNPWRSLSDWLARVWPGYTAGRLAYPPALCYWPALLLYAAFIWLELFGNTRPFSLGLILAVYTALNLGGVWLFGSAAWFRHCEVFAVLFRLLAKCAPLEYRPEADSPRRRLLLRWPFAGLLEHGDEDLSLLLFILFMLSSTAFDGLHETTVWVGWFWLDIYEWIKPWVGANPFAAYPTLRKLYLGYQTLALLLSPLLYLAVYWLFIRLARWAARSCLPTRLLALRFANSLLPIVLVYHVAHYYTLLLTQGRKILSLASDPFGKRWDLFGTAGWFRAPLIPDMLTVWHVQVGLIVAGHVLSVWVAHVEALSLFPSRRQALLSQLPMLLLMLLFTVGGLWILSQPIKPAR